MKTRRSVPLLLSLCLVALVSGGADECQYGTEGEPEVCSNELDDDDDGGLDHASGHHLDWTRL